MFEKLFLYFNLSPLLTRTEGFVINDNNDNNNYYYYILVLKVGVSHYFSINKAKKDVNLIFYFHYYY